MGVWQRRPGLQGGASSWPRLRCVGPGADRAFLGPLLSSKRPVASSSMAARALTVGPPWLRQQAARHKSSSAISGVEGSGSRLSWDGCCHREPLDPSRQCSHCRRLSSEHQLRDGLQVNPSLIVVFQLFSAVQHFSASTDILAFATNITSHASHPSIAS